MAAPRVLVVQPRSPVVRGHAVDGWERRLQELLDFRARHGHIYVPRGWAENRGLSHWVTNQRRLILWGTMRRARLRRLEEEGIRWIAKGDRVEAQEITWSRMVGSLRAFQRIHGHLDVPRGWPAEPSLAGWAATQRYLRKRGALAESRIRRLEELGFEWSRPRPSARPAPARREGRAEAWERQLEALEKYKNAHGHCAVPSRWDGDRTLSHWVANQRALKKRGLLPPDRVERLTRLGFEWSVALRRAVVRERQWEAMRDAYVGVRTGRVSDPRIRHRLNSWITRQRNDREAGRLMEERRLRLDEIGFVWDRVGSL